MRPGQRSFVFVALVVAFAAAVAVAEAVARRIDPAPIVEGGSMPQLDPVIGWLPSPGVHRTTTSEFSVAADVNVLGMNDRPVGDRDRTLPARVLAVGDSHTFALGVAQSDAWPLVVDRMLFGANEDDRRGRVFNAGVPAYNIGQYLQRFRMLQPVLRPHVVLVGISMATDLFDLLPPRAGGFVVENDVPRVYFDLDGGGNLIERPFTPAMIGGPGTSAVEDDGLRLRILLRRSALFRMFQSSLFALRIATAVKLPGVDALWAGPEAVLRRDLSDRERFQWALASAILHRFVKEVHDADAEVVLVVIPYLPEVYDEVWNATFGRSGAYDREIGSRRMTEIARSSGAFIVDTTPALVAEARRTGRWLHYRKDKHPNADGHRVIGATVASFLAAHPKMLYGRHASGAR
jgi:lysophospholipase L1-like esterase